MDAPLVSVVIPAYQRAASVRASIDSALAQTMGDLEVIVVDDGSTDGTPEAVRAVRDPRVRLIVHETNRGGNAARQTGIDAARGTWVAFLDSDDTWAEAKLARQLARLAQAGADFRFCYTWYDVILGDGTVRPPRGTSVEGFHRPELLAGNIVGTFSTMLVARDLLAELGGLDLSLPSCQDWDLVIRANRVTGLCVVPEVLVHYAHAEGDPHRISTRKTSVIEGHRRVYDRLREDYPQMSDADVAASQEFVMEVFAQQGAVLDVLRVVRDLRPRAVDADRARHAGHMIARAGRRRLTSPRG
ncbi:MAG: glycosyltransferase family 2 protein [Austwickia sp.]|jgi:GT2 family glycosyltransferase|nr:MAG: glycosyltransferase family 2 protein [Austwickia sp.]